MPIDYGYTSTARVKVWLDDPTEAPELIRYWRNKPEIRDWCRENDLIQTFQHEKWLESLRSGRDRMYLICAGIDHRAMIGVCGLTSINWHHRTAEWSMYLDTDYWGKRLAEPVLRTLLRHGFDSLNLECVWGEIFATNSACLKLAEKIGFKQDGVLRSRYYKQGKRLDAVAVSILKEEFKP